MSDALPPDGIDRATVERAIASGFRLLKFPRALEAAFEHETGAERCRRLIIGGAIGICIFDLFLISDYWLTPDVFNLALWLRLGAFTPFGLACLLWFRACPPPAVRELIVIIGSAVIATIAQLYLMLVSRAPHMDAEHQSIILIVLFVTTMQRARFWYLLPGCIAAFALHALAIAALPNYSFDQQLSANIVLGFAIIFAFVASYVLEHEVRLNYLLAWRSRLQNRELDAISRRDSLTGLGNRRSLDETLATCERDASGDMLALVLFDIDHFKLFNDTAGHQAGDLCLRLIAGILAAELGARTDSAFRFGGEEFIVLLRAGDLSDAIGLAERLRRAIEDAAVPHPDKNIGIVTASFGVAAAILSTAVPATELIAGADAALYVAKRNGRNQVWPRFPSALASEAREEPADRRIRIG